MKSIKLPRLRTAETREYPEYKECTLNPPDHAERLAALIAGYQLAMTHKTESAARAAGIPTTAADILRPTRFADNGE